MADRFFVETRIQGQTARLVAAEAHHLIHVLRAKPGTRVTLFDGSGAEFLAEVCEARRNDVELTILQRQEIDRELPVDLVLGVSLPKGDRQKWLVEKAVELGVRRIVPLKTERSVAQPVRQALDRLGRSVIEACKQCGRNRLLELSEPLDWQEFVTAETTAQARCVAHPASRHSGPVLKAMPPLRSSRPAPVLLAVGPEGGLTSAEVGLAASAGWHLLDLGPRILRVETAALAMVAEACQRLHECGE